MNIFDLAAKLTLDSSEYVKGLTDADKETTSFASKLKTGLATGAKIGAAAIATVTAAAAKTASTIFKSANEVAAYGDNVDKMSQKIGISAKAYQEWDAILKHCGASVNSLQPAMKTLANQAQTGSEAFERLGISQEEVANLSQEDLFAKVVEGLQNMEEGTERTYLASQLLGRGATELGVLFNTSAEDTEKMRQTVHDLGGVMSDEGVKSAASFKDSLQDLTTAFDAVKRNVVQEFLPSIQSAMDGFTMLFSGNADGGIEKIISGIETLGTKLGDALPKIVKKVVQNAPKLFEAGREIILSIVQSFSENAKEIADGAVMLISSLAVEIGKLAPEIIPAVVEIILAIVNAFTDPENVDVMTDAAIALIMGLADGLIAAIPILIENLPQIIINIVQALIENAPKLLEAGVVLIAKLIEGLGKAAVAIFNAGKELVIKIGEGIASLWSKVKNWASDIWEKIKEGFEALWEKIKTIGRNIIEGIWEGIKAAWSWITEKVGGFFSGLVDWIKDLLGIHSPSTVFADIGKNMIAGLGKGFDDSFGKLDKDVKSKMQQLTDDATVSVSSDANFGEIGLGYSGKNSDVQVVGGVYSTIISLLTDIRDRIGGDVVLDSGELVGYIDSALGTLSTAKARGMA